MGTIAAALRQGVPLVCQPVARDQPLNAERVRRLGAGVVLDTTESADSIATVVEHLLSEQSYRNNAQKLAQASREAGETTAAVEAILGLTTHA